MTNSYAPKAESTVTPWDLGNRSCKEGKHYDTHNPFDLGSEEWHEWRAGWIYAYGEWLL